MLKCQELSIPSSCLNKAGATEPLFVLRANDPLAAQTIRHWATMSVNFHEAEKCEEALKVADAMEAWRKGNIPTPAAPVGQINRNSRIG